MNIGMGKFTLCAAAVCRARQICEAVIVMKYLEEAVKERITNREECGFIRVSPEEHGHNEMGSERHAARPSKRLTEAVLE